MYSHTHTRSVCSFVLDVAAVDKLLELKDNWGAAAADLHNVVESSLLGERMFSFALVDCTSFQVTEAITNAINAVLKGHITMEKVNSAVRAAQAAIDNLVGVDRLSMKRVVEVVYRGVACKVEVSSVHEQKILQISSLLKQCALGVQKGSGDKALVPLFCENALAPPVQPYGHLIDDEVLVNYNTCRTTANDMMTEEALANGHQVREFLKCKGDTLYQIDQTIKLECAWFEQMVQHGAQARLEDMAIAALPKDVGIHCPKQCALKLSELKKIDLYKFVGNEAQSSVNLTYELVFAISQNRSPTMHVCQKNAFFRRVGSLLQWFVAVRDPENETELLGGAAALNARFKITMGMVEKDPSGVNFDVLRDFHTYSWLLTKDQQDLHNTWVSQAFGGKKKPNDRAGAHAAGQKRDASNHDADESTAKKQATNKALSYFQ